MYAIWIDSPYNRDMARGVISSQGCVVGARGSDVRVRGRGIEEEDLTPELRPVRYNFTEGEDGLAHLGLSFSSDDDEVGRRMGTGRMRLRWGEIFGGRSGC